MSYSINYQLYQNSIAVPSVITDAVKLASGESLKCILYILSHPTSPISPQELSEQLHISQDTVEESLLFWQSLSVLQADNDLNPAEEETDISTVIPQKAKSVLNQSFQKPSRSEIAQRTAEDDTIRFLLQQAELYLGRTLTVSDAGTLIALHDWAGLESNVLLTVIAYCCSKKQTGIRAIQKEALAWADAGINSCEKAEEHIRTLEQQSRAAEDIKKILSLPETRILKPAERQMASDWLCSMKIPPVLLEEAGKRSVSSYGTVRFSAIGKLVSLWHSKGLQTLEDILSYESVSLPTVPKTRTKQAQGFVSANPSFTIEDLKVHNTAIPTYKRRGKKDD